jgi:hypothetical protein
MTGVTIDHMVSLILLITVLVAATGMYNQMFYAAIDYQRHHQVAVKAVDLIDNICLNPGWPVYWGESNCTPVAFGIHQPKSTGYSLSPHSLIRLLSSAGGRVYYNRTGEWYSNVSWGLDGGYLLVPVTSCVEYETASKLLGVNGSYGFQLSVVQTLRISIKEIHLDPLGFEVEVIGPGLPLIEADLDYIIYWTLGEKDPDGCPLLNFTSGTARTNSAGVAYLNFSDNPRISVSSNRTAYTIMVSANLGGLHSVGYKSREIVTSAGNIIPFIENLGNRTVLLAHKWGKNDPDGNQGALHFSATSFALSGSGEPIEVDMQNSTGLVNYGKGGKPFHRVQIPTSDQGFLVVAYCKGNEFGMVIMPWGIHTLGTSVVFGGDPSIQDWVATDLRQARVGELSYQVKIAAWNLKGRQVWGG